MKRQTPEDLVAAIEGNLVLDARCAESAAFECHLKGGERESRLLNAVAQEVWDVIKRMRGLRLPPA